MQFASKQMERSAKKCEKDEKAEKVKLKKVIPCHYIYYLFIYLFIVIIF